MQTYGRTWLSDPCTRIGWLWFIPSTCIHGTASSESWVRKRFICSPLMSTTQLIFIGLFFFWCWNPEMILFSNRFFDNILSQDLAQLLITTCTINCLSTTTAIFSCKRKRVFTLHSWILNFSAVLSVYVNRWMVILLSNGPLSSISLSPRALCLCHRYWDMILGSYRNPSEVAQFNEGT